MSDSPVKHDGQAMSIVSGKGGSGKTMVAATMAKVLDSIGFKVLLVDADYGTAGLTYYMGLNTVSNIGVGLSGLFEELEVGASLGRYCQPMVDFGRAMFLGVGDHKKHLRGDLLKYQDVFIEEIIKVAKSEFDFILIDCRGGVDAESLAICDAVDKILVVAETDTTSFQATQYLVDVLADNYMAEKLCGFLINKVFDDPSSVARAGTASFRSRYLDSVPFDLDATRSFLVGEIPSSKSMFFSQVWQVLFKVFPQEVLPPRLRSLSFNDYRGLSLRDNDSLFGGMAIAFLSLAIFTMFSLQNVYAVMGDKSDYQVGIAVLAFLGVSSGIEPARKSIGRVVGFYRKMIVNVFTGGSRR